VDAVEFAAGTQQFAVERVAVERVVVVGFLDKTRRRELCTQSRQEAEKISKLSLMVCIWSQIRVGAVVDKREKEQSERYLTWARFFSIRHFAIRNMFAITKS
jgi:hypothetical protein